MDIVEAYDAILEDYECPMCGHIGMESDGGYDFYCPECGYEGTLEDEDY